MYTVLCVDDEINILRSLKRLFHSEKDITLLTANNAQEGAVILKQQPVDLVLSDERMPQIQGSDFLRFVKQHYPDTVRIILTGYSNNEAILKAINEGEVYRYLLKPWNDDELLIVIKNALQFAQLRKENEQLNMKVVKQNNQLKDMNNKLEELVKVRTNQLQQALISLKEAHGKTELNLAQTIELLSNVITMYNNELGSHTRRVANIVKKLSESMNLENSDLGFQAALLHEIGNIGSDTIQEKSSETSAKILGGIYGLKKIAEVIENIDENFNGGGSPRGLVGDQIPFLSRAIRMASDYDRLLLENDNDQATALGLLRKKKYVYYDPDLFSAFERTIQPEGHMITSRIIKIPIEQLKAGCRLASCIEMNNNVTIIPEETIMTKELIEKLENFKDLLNKRVVRIYSVLTESTGEKNE